MLQLDISDDGYLNLMSDDGDTKDDVKMPDGEIGEKITKLFKVDEKDTSKLPAYLPATWRIWRGGIPREEGMLMFRACQTSLFLPPWVKRPLWKPKRLPAVIIKDRRVPRVRLRQGRLRSNSAAAVATAFVEVVLAGLPAPLSLIRLGLLKPLSSEFYGEHRLVTIGLDWTS